MTRVSTHVIVQQAHAAATCDVTTLDIEALPRGTVSRLRVEIVQDAMGWPIRLPVLVARGERPGPVFGITAALHGDELNGIPVIHHLFAKLDPRLLRGSVVAVVVVNTPGFGMHQRGFSDGGDLNHIMPGRRDGNVAQVYAHRLVERIVRQFGFLVDLHTASFGRINSLYVRADMTDAMAAQLAYLQRPQLILHNPPSDGTLRGTAMELGIPAITVEIGDPQRFQADYIRCALKGVRAMLAEAGMMPRRTGPLGPPPVVCGRSYWVYTDHGGLLDVFPNVMQRVHKGDVIARLHDVFGEVLREYRAPEAGVVIGKSINPVGQTGARVLHLGIEADVRAYAFHEPKRETRHEPSSSITSPQED